MAAPSAPLCAFISSRIVYEAGVTLDTLHIKELPPTARAFESKGISLVNEGHDAARFQ